MSDEAATAVAVAPTGLSPGTPSAFDHFVFLLMFVNDRINAIATTLALLVVLYILYRMHRGRNSVDLADLICTDGYINDKKFRKTGAFAVTTWGFVVLTLAKSLPEWYVLTYMTAWVADAGYDRYIRYKENVALGENASAIRGDRPPAPPEPDIPEGANPK
jgi:exosortase/archaeosortase